jgi:acetoin utilization deacetylase AcuC-like enzyme
MDHATRRRVAATYGTGVFVSRRRPHELSALASVLPAAAHNTATTQLVYSLCDAPGHASPEHPECPARIAAITAALRHGLLDQHPAVRQLPRTTSTAAAEAGLALVHPPAYLRRLQELCGTLQAPTMIDDATYMAPRSYDAACEVG